MTNNCLLAMSNGEYKHGQPPLVLAPKRLYAADADRPLRVGYVSADFFHHPVGRFLEPVWAAHDTSRFIINAYSGVVREDALTDRLRAHASQWRQTLGLSDDELEEQIRADDIDILVDLAGHTGGNRLTVFARRPAPVQVSWLGYFNTTGLPAIDAVFMDADTVAPGIERQFVEEVVMLPDSRFCFNPPPYAPAVGRLPCQRRGFVTFGSFNNLTKVTPQVLALWARVLDQVPGSRLILKWKTLRDAGERSRLAASFAAVGGDPTRLDLRAASAHVDMLAEYGDIDIALDPFPFSGGITSCEALWMGVPVITWPSMRPVSRQTFGFLNLLGLADELVANSADRYEAIAASLARAPDRLGALRAELRGRMQASALCDAPRFARNLEAAYRRLWIQRCAANHDRQ